MHDSADAQRIAAAWLAPDGLLGDLGGMVHRWADVRIDLVLHLAPVNPTAALDLIERFVLGSAPDQLMAAPQRNRYALISLLRKLAWFPEYFRRVALCLSRFVQTEPTAGNRSQDTVYLEGLFWIKLSGTSAGPHQRFPVVEELLAAPDYPTQDIGMIALCGMLNAGHFTSSHGFSPRSSPV